MTIKAHKVETIVKKVLTKVFPRIIITSCKSYDEEGRDHFASQRAGRDDPDDYRFRAGTPNKKV